MTEKSKSKGAEAKILTPRMVHVLKALSGERCYTLVKVSIPQYKILH